MKKLIFFTDDSQIHKLVGLSHNELWEAGLNLDDWDYGLLLTGKKAHECESDWELNRLLTGVCSNEWFQIKNKEGKWFTFGMAYHS